MRKIISNRSLCVRTLRNGIVGATADVSWDSKKPTVTVPPEFLPPNIQLSTKPLSRFCVALRDWYRSSKCNALLLPRWRNEKHCDLSLGSLSRWWITVPRSVLLTCLQTLGQPYREVRIARHESLHLSVWAFLKADSPAPIKPSGESLQLWVLLS